MIDSKVEAFCDKVKAILGAAECLPFSGRFESAAALFDIIQLDVRDCVYLSILAPRELVRAVMMCGAVPVFCDVVPDSLTIDPKALENLVRHTISEGSLYPRAVIADNFCGMPFASKAVKSVCTRLGLILIEDCGKDAGGVSDGAQCGSSGDYSLISLGGSSLFGTGGSGSLLIANGTNAAGECLDSGLCGDTYQSIDKIYADNLIDSLEKADDVLSQSKAVVSEIDALTAEHDSWIQRGGKQQKSSFGSIAVITREEDECKRIVESLGETEAARFVKPMHAHVRGCFGNASRGYKDIVNGTSIAPRAFILDIFGAVHNGSTEMLIEQLKKVL